MRAYLLSTIALIILICESVKARQDCMTTCCQLCSGEPFCSLCRRLNEDKEGCKCVTKEKLKNKETFSHLKLRDPPESEVLNDLTRREAVLDNDKNTEKKKRNVPKCRPACCPRPNCNVKVVPDNLADRYSFIY